MIPHEHIERARRMLLVRALDPRTVERELRHDGLSRKQAQTCIAIVRRGDHGVSR